MLPEKNYKAHLPGKAVEAIALEPTPGMMYVVHKRGKGYRYEIHMMQEHADRILEDLWDRVFHFDADPPEYKVACKEALPRVAAKLRAQGYTYGGTDTDVHRWWVRGAPAFTKRDLS